MNGEHIMMTGSDNVSAIIKNGITIGNTQQMAITAMITITKLIKMSKISLSISSYLILYILCYLVKDIPVVFDVFEPFRPLPHFLHKFQVRVVDHCSYLLHTASCLYKEIGGIDPIVISDFRVIVKAVTH